MTPKEVLERAVFAGCCEHGIDDMLQHSEWDDLSPESRGMYSDIADACLRDLRAAGYVIVPVSVGQAIKLAHKVIDYTILERMTLQDAAEKLAAAEGG